jgi:hypothetical protein
MLKTGKSLIYLIVLSMAIVMISCHKKDKIDSNPSLLLSFSTDTIMFDTVFTSVGSVTQRLLVYNNNSSKIQVSSIELAGGSQSYYSMNVDGVAANTLTNIDIPANDSIFIFVKVSINPQNQSLPFVVSDSILFLTNGNRQNVKLVAWGQDAYFYNKTILRGNITWDSLKPRVVYGKLTVDTGSSLTLLPGVKMYFHANSELDIAYNASLNIQGNLGQEVKFQGDRLDPFYKDLPGQWNGIYLKRGSKSNIIKYAIIKNGNWGVYIDSIPASSSDPVLTIDDAIIQNVAYGGIYAYSTTVKSTNCVIGNCGGSSLSMIKGGNYDFSQLTIGNYWNSSVRNSPSIYITNYAYDGVGNKILHDLTNANIINSIIFGVESEEMYTDAASGAQFNLLFDHCFIKTEQKIDSAHFTYCWLNQDPRFLDPVNYKYQIDSISPAIGRGKYISLYSDIMGVPWTNPPDLGAYMHKQ